MTANQIKAIETVYGGCRFRSRLEARWAVFFNAVGLTWQYEPEGFELPCGTHYLPDFLIPGVDGGDDSYFEIKPYTPTKAENGYSYCKTDPKVDAARKAGLHLVQLNGIENPHTPNRVYSFDHPYEGTSYGWAVCPFSGRVGIAFDHRGARVYPDHPHNTDHPKKEHVDQWFLDNPQSNWQHGGKAYSGNHPKIINAFLRANMARFEHGERG